MTMGPGRWLLALLWLTYFTFTGYAQYVTQIQPNDGSLNGATIVTILGSGFSQANQFNYGPGESQLGNSVMMVSNTRSIPCDVDKDSSRATVITCYTRPMPADNYVVQVSVDGTMIPQSNMCNGNYNSYYCSFYPRSYRTPTISQITPQTGLPGSLITIRGMIFTDVYGSNTALSSNGLNVRILRVYIRGMPCVLLVPNSDTRYGLALDNQYSYWGTMTCRITSTYVGHHNVSFILDSDYGRSLPYLSTYFISALDKLAMFQSYAEIYSIFPSAGSLEGGTILTINGNYFDQTNSPARILVGGQDCPLLSLSNNVIICTVPAQPVTNRTLFGGGRGLQLEVWNNTVPHTLDDVLAYDTSMPGYYTMWVDSSSYAWPANYNNFVARLSGFFTPTVTDDYRFYIRGDDRCALYFSQTGLPKDKVKIAYLTSARSSFFQDPNQASQLMHLEEDQEYYIEILFQQYSSNAFVDLAIYQKNTSFTALQTPDAISEVQVINTQSIVLIEKQEICFVNWTSETPVKEVQQIVVNSSCFSLGYCAYLQYTLIYNNEKTAPISVDASSDVIQNALNAFDSIKPDSVVVTKTESASGSVYIVTFDSTRGDFNVLQYDTGGSNISISISEITQGKPGLDTFTLMWDGVTSSPLSANATAGQVNDELWGLLSAKCPSSINGYTEGPQVKYFRDYETAAEMPTGNQRGTRVFNTEAFCGSYSLMTPQILFDSNDVTSSGLPYGNVSLLTYDTLCFAYRGFISNTIGVTFSYVQTGAKSPSTSNGLLVVDITQGAEWQYTCIDLRQSLQASYPGSFYSLQQITLSQSDPNQDFFIDTVYWGSGPSSFSPPDLLLRRNAALAERGVFVHNIDVVKSQEAGTSNNCYTISLTPFNCGCDFPLLGIAFAQVLSGDGETTATYGGSNWDVAATMKVTRLQPASPPVGGVFDLSIYGQVVNGIPVNSSALDLQFALESIPQMGQLAVSRSGDCRGYSWTVTWLSVPGDQPPFEINSSSVTGVNASITANTLTDGGAMRRHIFGDALRVPSTEPQVQVYINDIMSLCSGNCTYQWDPMTTPVVSAITPTSGSSALGTILTITGTRLSSSLANESTSVSIGGANCTVTQISDTQITCEVGDAAAGSAPVTVYVPAVGLAQSPFTFANLLGVTSASPLTGSIAGGTVLTLTGYGFGPDTTVTMNEQLCTVLTVNLNAVRCQTPAAAPGAVTLTVRTAGMEDSLDTTFTYDMAVTPIIESISPQTTNVMGNTSLTISGSQFESQSSVLIGNSNCKITEWTNSVIICTLPVLPPGTYNILLQVGNWGYANASDGVNTSIEYILEINSVSPLEGSMYGGTTISVTGSGFSTNPNDTQVLMGNNICKVTLATESELECVVQPAGNLHVVTNLGIDINRGIGYAWTPSSLEVFVGDTVQWQWQAQSLIGGIGYRVFSVANPGDTTFSGQGFNSGPSGTPSGFFQYQFLVPGVYYYSSGYIDAAQTTFLQGVVTVQALPDSQQQVHISVAGQEANYVPTTPRSRRDVNDCTETALNCSLTSTLNTSRDGFFFHFSSCYSPTITGISPSSGTIYEVLTIMGTGFSDIACANQVTVGGHPCDVISSTSTEINCTVNPENVLPVGFAEPVAVRVNNLGNAISTIINELDRRFVLLPVISFISPSVGSTTGHTRVTIQGSGFTGQNSSLGVTAVNLACSTVSVNYTTIICDTAPSSARTGRVQVSVNGIPAACHSDCSFQYTASSTPVVQSLTPSTIDSNSTLLSISGAGFGNNTEDVVVFIGNFTYQPSEVADAEITCPIGALPAGSYIVNVVVMSKGLASGSLTISSLATATLSPNSGSILGGTTLLITGNGFDPGYTTVTVGNTLCPITYISTSEIECVTPPHNQGNVNVIIGVWSTVYSSLNFLYSQTNTPVVSLVSPSTGAFGTVISISGSRFGSTVQDIFVTIGDVPCIVEAVSDSQVLCTVGSHSGGSFPIVLRHAVLGYASSSVSFEYELLITSVTPNEGSFGGGSILELEGAGFDGLLSSVSVCGSTCIVDTQRSNASTLYCEVPPSNGTGTQLVCDVSVVNGNTSMTSRQAFTYKSSLTPVITSVSPRRGGTGGGTSLTITGSGFSSTLSDVQVTIAGTPCDVQLASSTQIICVTNNNSQSQQTYVKVNIGGNGIAKLDNASFFYIDVWSSNFTWGGDSPPDAGSLAVISQGQTVLLDVSTPVLKMLLIQGGTLIFDEADIELKAENILIANGGTLQIGTEAAPFQHKAIITLYGQLRSPELPVYGAKTLAVRQGVLDLHGVPIPVTWTRLAQTANAGSSTLQLQQSVTWNVGDEIAIASTGDRLSQSENELMVIQSISPDGKTLTLTQPLNYTHLGVSVTLPNGKVFEARAEVGVLTRNIVVRGSNNDEWDDKIPACPDGFDPGEFAVQTCFQGRFGEEIGSDQFGGCIMFNAPQPNLNLAIGRIEYVEVFHAGQAFRLGRYPIHWHLMGDINFKSYVRGCGIHQTYNRAVTIHNTHHLLVEKNVIYDIMGGAFFIEDGIETGNILQYNLAVFVKQSTSLLNDDVTPAGYWVTNPNNTVRHNAAAGGTHFGFWYRMHNNPDGPSYTPNVCQKRVPLGQFYNNTVHSQGWYGIWIFQEYFPMQQGSCYLNAPQPAVFDSLTTWNSQKGAEWVNGGALQFKNFVVVNNELAGIEMKRILSSYVKGWGETSGAMIMNATVVGHLDQLGLGPNHCSTRGIVLPFDEGLTVEAINFVNFDRSGCAAIGVTSIDGTCTDRCGGWSARFSGVQYSNATNKAGFRWEHEVVLVDNDGTLTGNANYKVVAQSALLDPAHCAPPTPEWSAGFPGSVCDSTVSFHRLAFGNALPSSLFGKNAILTDDYGSSVVPFLPKRLTYKPGWMALIPNGKTFNWYFQNAGQITNISYLATFYGFKSPDFVIISHNFTQRPDMFNIVDTRNESSHPLNSSSNVNGDWYFNDNTTTLTYLMSGTQNPRKRRDTSVDPSVVDINVRFNVYSCFFKNCNPPIPPTVAPLPETRPGNFDLWSNNSFWTSSAENNYTVPKEGADVVIPEDRWVVMDVNIPTLNKLTIYGVLEVPNNVTGNSTSATNTTRQVIVRATYISIQGGKLVAGQEDAPFPDELHIILVGNQRTPEWPLPNGPNQGAKVLGVFGILDLHGKPHAVYRTKLAQTAEEGSDVISVTEAVDWQVGDDVLITTTSYDAWQTETRKIIGLSPDMKNLTLNESLTYTHIGEAYNVNGTDQEYSLAGDVGLLSRNIKIYSEDYPGWYQESYGARVLVGTFFENLQYTGTARISDVEFYHSGQEGFRDYPDPRYSVAFVDVGEISANASSYIKGCAFHQGFSPAIGVFGTNGLSVHDNVIHFTVGEGIRDWGIRNSIQRNLVALSVWPGTYQGRLELTNSLWHAAIEVNNGMNSILQDNIVSGFERVGYRINGEPCPGQFNPVEAWHNNEAHGGLYGVYMNKDGLPNCSFVQGFIAWKCWDYGIYFQTEMSVQVSNVTLVDNGMGIMPMNYHPPSVSHNYSDKTIEIKNSLFVGSSPNFNCSDILTNNNPNIQITVAHRSTRPLQGGRSGACWPTFASEQNLSPGHPHAGLMSYNTISGLMTVTDSTFVGYRNVCSGETNIMFISNPENEDLQHQIFVHGLTLIDSTEDAKVFIHRPDVGKANPSDCVDMVCDAKRKTMLKDLDGSFLGHTGTVVPQSEYQWNGDPRDGLGDYRIPKVMLTYLNGSRIPVNQIAPNKGIIRDPSCTYMPSWQSYKCFTLDYEMLVIESLDSDTETRRLSPVAVLADGYVDLINGPQDHGWCAGYTCQLRVSLFHSIVSTNTSYSIYFTSTSPQNLRLMLLNANDTKVLRVAIFYSDPQRLDIFVNNSLVAPTNAVWNSDHSDYTLNAPTYPDEFVPEMNSTISGSNYFDEDYKMINILIRGSTPIEIQTAPVLFISFEMPSMTVEQFYGPSLVQNLAIFLNIPANKIKITKIVRASSRRRRSTGISVQIEISNPPVQNLNQNSSAGTLKAQDLMNLGNIIGKQAITGNLSSAIGFVVKSVAITLPPPSSSDPAWSKFASAEVTRNSQTPAFVSTVDSLVIVIQPIPGQTSGLLTQQPCIMAVDSNGNCVSVGVTSFVIIASLKNSNNQSVAGLEGNITIPFSGCWANFTDLSLTVNGTNLMISFTMNNIQSQSRSFTLGGLTAPAATASGGGTTTTTGSNVSSGAPRPEAVFILFLLYYVCDFLFRE
ncbi:PKHD1 like 1, tandem duplicate 1 [Erpetoichthys calabaricus]|uniref:PKHD1 like 1, tandem duplicate 1 n=1 Tax=Erpetoichthys calabaricus TaxID=27687 RepID=UPI002234052E|nr:PKHD1 like 1, tandem duplicate 1 [Erpetoichthys calabaricus]